MDVIIRPMELKDIEGVHQIDVLSFSMPWPERSFRFELTENPATRLWVAEAVENDGEKNLAGMLVMWVVVDEGHIGTFAVHPDYRQHGIGRRLLLIALLDAARKGMRRVFLEVRQNNRVAQNLYRQIGFKVEGVRQKYYRDTGENALLMTLENLDPGDLQKQIEKQDHEK